MNDATALAQLLIDKLGFPQANVTLLIDRAATRDSISQAFHSLAGYGTQHDDRVIIFFAGHGHTIPSMRGEVGFLVPHDGTPNDLSSLIRWDDFTRGADLIRAKHILFLMDACYGGLAVSRSLNPGAMRFLSDMLRRISRQVLTAGKADEQVSDSGGPIPNHSVFTGHLLEALSGKAADRDGNITANGVTAYVYHSVGADPSSYQTPHYGYLHGDGDLIFHPMFSADSSDPIPDDEQLVAVPASLVDGQVEEANEMERLKELLSEDRFRIQLHDFVAGEIQRVLTSTGEDHFSLKDKVSVDSLLDRYHRYESSMLPLLKQEMLLGRWGSERQLEPFLMPLKRLAERIAPASGTTALTHSRWYPVFLLMYAGGLGAIAGDNYTYLSRMFHCPVRNTLGRENKDVLVTALTDDFAQVYDIFKMFPGQEKKHPPRSEYIYHLLQPTADDVLLLGSGWEEIFDRFELLYALEYAHIKEPLDLGPDLEVWGPIGRFGWKGKHFGQSPLLKLLAEADRAGAAWPPLQAGLFGGSLKRLQELIGALSRLVAKLPYF